MDWRSCLGSAKFLKVGTLALVLLFSQGWPAAGSAGEKPTLIALTLDTEDGRVTIVVPEGKTATHRDYAKGIYLGFVPTVQDLAGGDVDVQVFTLRDGSGAPERQKEIGHISAKLGFRDIVRAVPELELTVTAIGHDLQHMAKLTGRQCSSSKVVQPPYASFIGGGGGCCVSCGGSTSCGCAVGGGCGSCCGGCCAW